ncbi:MAG: MarR family transcriptional regulator [Hyphomicrobiales bacterium]|nr:MAG: MarR family transcriptional regulator [Hyphomicrobiales bacterium]
MLRDLTRNLLLAGRQWRKIGRQVAARHGVSEAASAPLLWIERLGENVRQNALADAIGIEGASLVRLLDELQTHGFITRVPDPADRRANAVNLTDAGWTVVHEVNDALNELRLEVFAGVSRKDIEATLRVFDAIDDAAGAVDETP